MAEVCFEVDDAFLENLRKNLGMVTSIDVAREALTLLNWAVKERLAGRDVVSVDHNRIHANLAMPSLEAIVVPSQKPME